MTSARTIINRAAEVIGYKDPEETLSGSDASNFLGVLNSMVDAWASQANPLLVYAVANTVQTVSGNPITIGPGAAIDTARPVNIPSGGFFREGTTDYGFSMISRVQYESFMDKSSNTPWPRYCYYEPGLPTGSLYFYPALSAPGELHLPVEQRLSSFADLDTDYTLAPGFKAALEYSLAEELAPGRRPIDPQIARLAMKYRRGIETFEPPILDTGFETRHGNILTGWL